MSRTTSQICLFFAITLLALIVSSANAQQSSMELTDFQTSIQGASGEVERSSNIEGKGDRILVERSNDGSTFSSITTPSQPLQIQVMPNPVRVGNNVVVGIQGSTVDQARVLLIDAAGNPHRIKSLPDGDRIHLKTSIVPAGKYLVAVRVADGRKATAKLTIY